MPNLQNLALFVLVLVATACGNRTGPVAVPDAGVGATSTETRQISDFQGTWILLHADTAPVMVRVDPSKVRPCTAADAGAAASVSSVRKNGREYTIDRVGTMGLAKGGYVVRAGDPDIGDIYPSLVCRIGEGKPLFNYDMILGKMPTEDPNVTIHFAYSNLVIRQAKLVIGGLWCYDHAKGDDLSFCQYEIFAEPKFPGNVFYLEHLGPKTY